MADLTPSDLARELGKERREVIQLCVELGIPIVDGRINKEEFMAADSFTFIKVSAPCRRCVERGKTWQGSDPVCGFPTGTFDRENWNCATLNALRDMVEKTGVRVWHDDSNAAILAEPEHEDGRGGGWVYLEWYKSRGRTELVLYSDARETGPRRITLAEAERILDSPPEHPHVHPGTAL